MGFKLGDLVTYNSDLYTSLIQPMGTYNNEWLSKRIDHYTGIIIKLENGSIFHNNSYLNYITILNTNGEEVIDYIYGFKLDIEKIRNNKLTELLN